jgi:hypothetical protein
MSKQVGEAINTRKKAMVERENQQQKTLLIDRSATARQDPFETMPIRQT